MPIPRVKITVKAKFGEHGILKSQGFWWKTRRHVWERHMDEYLWERLRPELDKRNLKYEVNPV